MESYIHLYKTNSDFTAAYNSLDYKEPWLSLTEQNMEVNYNKPKLTAITFGTITWVTDVPAAGGTATKGNCSFKVYGNYDNGTSVDISSGATVTGELTVEKTTIKERHEAGQLTLTASYSGFTAMGNVTVYQEAFDLSMEPLTFNILSAGTINWTASDSTVTKTIDYKVNNDEWKSIKSNTGSSAPTITVKPGDKVQFRGNNEQYYDSSSYAYNSFSGSTALFEAEGNVMSLIYGDDFKNKLTISRAYAFASLFQNCVNLVSAKNLILPATTLVDCCYQSMFYGCTSLTAAPQLPATTLAYNCYSHMFTNCRKLTTAPVLPATTLATYCYSNMFQNCTSLTTAPVLPATTLANDCYSYMFWGCTSLTTAPVLPATTLANDCYSGMFLRCTNLNYIKCLATDISATNCTYSWVNGVASKGTFVKPSSMDDWTTGTNGIPSGWTVQDA